jgi:hypothetical protein
MQITPQWLRPYLLRGTESVHKAFYYLARLQNHRLVIVTEDALRAVGVLTPGDFAGDSSGLTPRYDDRGTEIRGHTYYDNRTAADICNRNFKYIRADENKYTAGRDIFADAGLKILNIPILDNNRIPVGIFARWQAFYQEYLETHRLQRMWYAESIMQAARLARKKGYGAISVLEFGVGGGTGLVLAELYAAETARLTGVDIEVYGFDLGTGLPEVTGVDKIECWKQGDYKMDVAALKNQLQTSKLVLGDIAETAKTFFSDYSPAPIGAMFVDVDLYSLTMSVLDMLLASDDHFLPTVFMWFDDLHNSGDYSGVWLALKDFNAKSSQSKITPESLVGGRTDAMGVILADDLWWSKQVKRNVRFSHPKIAAAREGNNPLELLL